MNASVLSDSGGTCVCSTSDLCVSDPDYLACVEDVRRELITTTAAMSALASATMGLVANLPVGLAPGLGINAYVSGSPHDRPNVHTSHEYDLRVGDLFDCWIPWLRSDYVSGGHGSGVLRRVRFSVICKGSTWLITACRLIFFVLSVFGLRQWLARMMPQSLVMAVGAGIGLFVAFVGLCELSIFYASQYAY